MTLSEVFKFNWLVIIKDTKTRMTYRVHNSGSLLKQIFEQNKNDIWVGYNSNHYDQWLFQAIVGGLQNEFVSQLSSALISGKSGYKALKQYKIQPNYNFYTYDTMYDKQKSLKQLEGFMGDDIHECEIPWDINRPLSMSELKSVFTYCEYDVDETMQVFMNTKSIFEARLGLIKEFKLPLTDISKSAAQLSAKILGAVKSYHNDEMDISIIETLRFNDNQDIADWYKNRWTYDEQYEKIILGVKHVLGAGGIHGARPNYTGTGFYVMSDVISMHPALMIGWDFLSRNVPEPQKFERIRDKRIILKAAKSPKNESYKLVLNATNGAAKDQYNPLYDPRQNNNVCVNAQLSLIDLIECVADLIEELVQSNTDGILVKLRSKDDLPEYIRRCEEWESRTRMILEHDEYVEVIQKDVNNYIIIDADGNFKHKGAYVKKLNAMDNDLAILNEAVLRYFVSDTPIEDTILECEDYKRFQKIVKRGPTFDGGSHNGKQLPHKVYRVFASTSHSDGSLYWTKGSRYSKVGNTPTKCFIDNDNINSKAIPNNLDKQWYIDQAHKRISDFLGMKNHKQIRLF